MARIKAAEVADIKTLPVLVIPSSGFELIEMVNGGLITMAEARKYLGLPTS